MGERNEQQSERRLQFAIDIAIGRLTKAHALVDPDIREQLKQLQSGESIKGKTENGDNWELIKRINGKGIYDLYVNDVPQGLFAKGKPEKM